MTLAEFCIIEFFIVILLLLAIRKRKNRDLKRINRYILLDLQKQKREKNTENIYSRIDKKIDRIPILKIIFSYIDNILTSGNIPLRTSEFLIIVLIIMLTSLVSYVFIKGQFGISSAFVVLSSLIIPFTGLKIYGLQRLKRIKRQLKLAISLLANNLEAGNSFIQSIRLVTSDLLPPLRTEFELLLQENQLGISLEKALINMMRRVPCKELQTLVRGIILQQETGSDLVYILRTIHKTLQDRDDIRNKINVLTVQGKLSGLICVMLPFLMFLFLHRFQPEYTQILLNTKTGNLLLGLCLMLITGGSLIIYKIVAFKF